MIKIKNHKLCSKSVEKLNWNELLDNKKATIFYSDPPWNNGNLKYWATMNKKQTGEIFTPLSFDQLIDEIKHCIINHVEGYVFIESGKKTINSIAEKMNDVLYNLKLFDVYYKSGNKWLPNKILVAGTNPKYFFQKNLTGIHCNGFKLPDICIGAVKKKGGIVLDPFCGLGNTAKATIKHNMIFRGNEFNQMRLSKTIKEIKKMI